MTGSAMEDQEKRAGDDRPYVFYRTSILNVGATIGRQRGLHIQNVTPFGEIIVQ